MGKRCEKEMRKIVFDLDGTLISFNTFKGWILISFIVPFLSLNFKSFKYISELIKKLVAQNLRNFYLFIKAQIHVGIK